MKFKFNNSEAMLYEYIDQLFDEYMKEERITEVELFLSKVRYQNENKKLSRIHTAVLAGGISE